MERRSQGEKCSEKCWKCFAQSFAHHDCLDNPTNVVSKIACVNMFKICPVAAVGIFDIRHSLLLGFHLDIAGRMCHRKFIYGTRMLILTFNQRHEATWKFKYWALNLELCVRAIKPERPRNVGGSGDASSAAGR